MSTQTIFVSCHEFTVANTLNQLKKVSPAAELGELGWVVSEYKAAYTQYKLFRYKILSCITK